MNFLAKSVCKNIFSLSSRHTKCGACGAGKRLQLTFAFEKEPAEQVGPSFCCCSTNLAVLNYRSAVWLKGDAEQLSIKLPVRMLL